VILAKAHKLQRIHPWIYVLACERDTFYVGFSRYLHNRLRCHFTGCGAYFTRQHRPLRVLELREARSEKDEFRLWTIYAEIYGTKRVGGWSRHLADEFGFDWPSVPLFTRAKYRPLGNTLFLHKMVDLTPILT
jgi:hypothetical protein